MENKQLKDILLLKSEELDDKQSSQIKELGYNPLMLQLLNFEYNQFQQNVEEAISQINSYDAIAFNSVNSVKAFAHVLKQKDFNPKKNFDPKVRIFCVGKKTKELIISLFSIEPQIVANSQEKLSEIMKELDFTGHLLYFIGNLSNLKVNFENFDKLQIKECLCYSTQSISKEQLLEQLLSKKIFEKQLHAIIYYSPSNTQFLLENIQYLKESKVDLNISSVSKHIAFGKKTLTELLLFKETHSIPDSAIFVCENSTFDDIIEILSRNI